MTDIVDAVAQAIWQGFLPGWSKFDVSWGDIAERSQDYYRTLARVAIDAHTQALGLSEERQSIPVVVGRVEHTQPCQLPGNLIASEEMHTCGYRLGHIMFQPSTRLVSPWRAEDNNDE